MNILVIIPVRGGSKGVPGKNIKPLGGIPLLWYTLQAASWVVPKENIVVSTDDVAIQKCAEEFGVSVPFLRPPHLATDTAGTYEVLLHALEHTPGKFDAVLLMQATSPFRTPGLVKNFVSHYKQLIVNNLATNMLVSVGQSAFNPYYNLFEEGNNECLQLSKTGSFTRRQDAPRVFFYTGSMYLIDTKSLLEMPLHKMPHVRKFLVEEEWMNQDIDTPLDWSICEHIVAHQPYKYESYSNNS